MRAIANDSDLIARTRAGDPDALGALYERHADALLALAHRLVGARSDAEDVLHDVFLGLPEALRRYEERGSLDGWLRRVTARVALNRLRTKRRARELSIDEPPGAGAPAPPLPHVRPLDTVNALALRDAIDALPDALRVVFVLREVEGYTHAEIAVLLGVTRGASEVRLHRAVAALRARLRPVA